MKSIWKFSIGVFCLMLVALFLLPAKNNTTPSQKQQSTDQNRSFTANDADTKSETDSIWVSEPIVPTISPPISELPTYEPEYFLDREINPRLNLSGLTDEDVAYPGGILGGVDPLLAVQDSAPEATDFAFLTPIVNMDGQGYTGVNPPDTVGDVGPNHYIQIINSGGGGLMMIYDKSGGVLAGPTALDSFGTGACASGLGDGIVLYDQMADRWMLSEFANSGNHLCIYISDGPDPVTSSWYAYDFPTPSFPDYPKYGVWPDAYYVSSNESSPAVYAMDRTSMLVGSAASAQRFTAPDLAGFGFQALIPSDLDGATPPPAGAPNYFMRHRDDEAHNVGSNNPTEDYLEIWPFHVDFAVPGNSTFTGPINIPIAEIDSELCGFFAFACFPQQGSGTTLDPLREVIMHRLQYRNFGSHEVLVGNLVTDVDGTDHGGIRWFELRKTGAGSWTLHQEGTYAPDANSRWMGAISMDGAGNIAVGYNVSSSSMFPSLRYTGRLAGDPMGTMPQGEGVLINGTAANGSNRYGDYSAMSVDPVDDCTFWFTGEYNASSTWSTRIGSFKFDACGEPDFTINATPPELAICTGNDAVYTVNIGQVSGYTDPVTLSSSGEPAGTTTGFSPNPVTPPGSSTMTVGNTAGAAPGNYTIDINGNSTSGTHMTQVDLDVTTATPSVPVLTTPANGATNIPTNPTFSWTAVAQATSYNIEIATDAGFTNIVDSASGLMTTSYMPAAALNSSTTYYWRVWAENPCGVGGYSAVYSFTTLAAPGDCGPGYTPVELFSDDFESGAPGWTSSGSGDTWILSTARPNSGTYAFHAEDVSSVSDQHLVSPEITLPSSGFPLALKFWNHQTIEASGPSSCFDGAVLEISTDNGSNWTRLESELLTDPYDGAISTSFSNPLGGENAWCGDPQDWLNSVVDLNAYAGQDVKFRFRLATDSSVGREGWYIDDVLVQACEQDATVDFSDGPVSYGVASHNDPAPTAARTLWLGPTVTNDPAPTPPGHDDASDDGVLRTGPWISGNNADVTVTVTGADGWIAGWVDWNGNGSFETPAERVLDQAVVSGVNNLSFPIPVSYVTGTAVEARFRLYTSEPGVPLAPTSEAEPVGDVNDGEVEDYTWMFTATAIDLNTINGAGVSSSPILIFVALLSATLIGYVFFVRRRRIE